MSNHRTKFLKRLLGVSSDRPVLHMIQRGTQADCIHNMLTFPSTNGYLVVCGPVVWDSMDTPTINHWLIPFSAAITSCNSVVPNFEWVAKFNSKSPWKMMLGRQLFLGDKRPIFRTFQDQTVKLPVFSHLFVKAHALLGFALWVLQ